MIFNSTDLVLSDDEESLPIIGYDNVINENNVDTTTEDADWPASNLGHAGTHLKWVGGINTSGIEYVTVDISNLDELDYVAIAKHNFGTEGYSISVELNTGDSPDWVPLTFASSELATSLVHFDGSDGSTTIVDDLAHAWTVNGDAQLDTAQFKFGGASLLCDGTGDFVTGDGHADFAFGLGNFTVELWFRLNATGAAQALYDSRPTGTNGLYPTIAVTSGNVLAYSTDSADRITGTTTLTTGVWYHVRLTRSGTSTRLFLNGAQEGSTYSDSNNYLNGASRPCIGASGNTGALGLDGWVDELRVKKGLAISTGSFSTQTVEYTTAIESEQITIDDDDPVIIRFEPAVLTGLRLKIVTAGESDTPPEIGAMYVGKLLVVERSIKVDVDHVPLRMGRKTKVVSGMSESGNFLGRVVLHETKQSTAEFAHITPDWYRTNFDPFVVNAQSYPFFFAWNPAEYPEDVNYAWLVNDPEPEVAPPTRRMSVELDMRGI